MTLKKIEIYLNDQWEDISNYVNMNQKIKLVTRCDEAFATGSFVAWLDRNTNIPPYTALKFTFTDNTTETYCCSSICKRYLTKSNLYMHEIELLDKSAWMSCWILGGKNFSSQTAWPEDWKKMYKIYGIMTEKYGVTYSRNGWDTKFTQNQEFTFGPGTTMYDAYCEIMGTYNCKPIVTEWRPETNYFKIGYKDLTASTEYSINDANVLYIEMRQDVDTYGNYLENEVANVIDRDNPLVVTDLTTRWDTVQMSADNNKLLLPTRIEKVNKFKVNIKNARQLNYKNLNVSSVFWEYLDQSTDECIFKDGNYQTLRAWCLRTIPKGETSYTKSPLYILLESATAAYPEEINIAQMLDENFVFNYENTYKTSAMLTNQGYFKADVTSLILEETQYGFLEPKDMPKYCYYKSGDYYIDGLNNRYKDDFWNKIFGNSEESFLKQLDTSRFDRNKTFSYGTSTLTYYVLVPESNKATESTFEVEYIPIIDMLMMSNKSVRPTNENSYKSISRSYSNGANFIDFNRLDFSMQKNNDFLGLEEFTIEYSIRNSTVPTPGQFINYNDIKWYIASCDRTISKDNDVVVINLVRDYNKIADAIGLKTQFESTKLPLNNIIDRNIYTVNDEACTFMPGCYVRLEVNGKVLWKRVAVLTAKKGVYITFETLDNYSFDKTAANLSGLTDYFEVKDVAYGNGYNEVTSCSYSFYKILNLSVKDSMSLPYYTGGGTMISATKTINSIYKDARERLLFTIYFPNATYDPNA